MNGIFAYSLIRVVPDPRRGEWVNIGVCIYLPDRLDIHIPKNLSKLRVLAPNLDTSFAERLPALWERLTNGLDSAEAKHAALKHLPHVHASEIGHFVCRPADYEKEVESILHDLVIPPPAKRPERTSRLQATIRKALADSKLMGKQAEDIRAHKVIEHYPINHAAGLYADFALKNSVFHFTQAIDFRVSIDVARSQKLGQAATKCVALDQATQHHPDCNRLVIYAASAATLEAAQPALNMLSGYAMHIFNAESRSDMANYIEILAAAARH